MIPILVSRALVLTANVEIMRYHSQNIHANRHIPATAVPVISEKVPLAETA